LIKNLFSKTAILLLRSELQALLHRARGFFIAFIEILKTTENWWATVGVYFGITEKVRVRFRAHSLMFFVAKDNWIKYGLLRKILLSKKIRYLGGSRFRFSHPKGLEFDCDGRLFFFAHASNMDCYYNDSNDVVIEVARMKFITPFPHGTFELEEIFINNMYGEPCYNNTVIVDVGAFIGDSAVFFASRGAKLVVAFEPVPVLFDFLKRNITLNGFNKLIRARNEAVSDVFGTFNIGYLPTRPGISSENPVDTALFFEVPSIPLSEVITGLGWVDILKIDCEGCEHRALQNAAKNGALKHVGMIIMELHFEVRSLIELLKSEGFRITQLRRIMRKRWILVAHRYEQ
jgi:FkbM family methyltransferase